MPSSILDDESLEVVETLCTWVAVCDGIGVSNETNQHIMKPQADFTNLRNLWSHCGVSLVV